MFRLKCLLYLCSDAAPEAHLHVRRGDTQPLIEMALRRTALSEEEILGLLGELRFLEILLSVTSSIEQRGMVLDSWRGHERGARDFVFGRCSVEVKSTRGDRSVHRISGVMQVDPRRAESQEVEEELFLLSLGFRQEGGEGESPSGVSLPVQVQTILRKLAPIDDLHGQGELQKLFLAKVASYLRDWFKRLLGRRAFLSALPGHLRGDSASQERLPDLEAKLRGLASLG